MEVMVAHIECEASWCQPCASRSEHSTALCEKKCAGHKEATEKGKASQSTASATVAMEMAESERMKVVASNPAPMKREADEKRETSEVRQDGYLANFVSARL